MQRKTVLLIPSSYYLSDAIFEKIASSSTYDYIYLDPQEYVYKKMNSSHQSGFGRHFKKQISLVQDLYGGSNRFLSFLSLQVKKVQILISVLRIKPDLIIAASDGTFTARVITYYFSKIPFVVLQTALIAVERDKYQIVKKSQIKILLIKLFGFLFFPFGSPQKPYGLNHSKAWLFLWGDSSSRLLKPHLTQQKIVLVGNAIFEPPKENSSLDDTVLFLAPDVKTNEEIKQFCRHVATVAIAKPEKFFNVRLHPIMDRKIYEQFFSEAQLKNVALVPRQQTLDESLLNCRSVISEYSAATLDALAMGRNVILYKKENEAYLSHWFDQISVPKVNTTQGVIDSLNSLTDAGKDSTQNQIKAHWYATGKDALGNILTGIDTILKGL